MFCRSLWLLRMNFHWDSFRIVQKFGLQQSPCQLNLSLRDQRFHTSWHQWWTKLLQQVNLTKFSRWIYSMSAVTFVQQIWSRNEWLSVLDLAVSVKKCRNWSIETCSGRQVAFPAALSAGQPNFADISRLRRMCSLSLQFLTGKNQRQVFTLTTTVNWKHLAFASSTDPLQLAACLKDLLRSDNQISGCKSERKCQKTHFIGRKTEISFMSYKSRAFLCINMKGFISCAFPIPKKIWRKRKRDLQLQIYVKSEMPYWT